MKFISDAKRKKYTKRHVRKIHYFTNPLDRAVASSSFKRLYLVRRVIQITITVFEKKTADILIVLARLPYNKPAYLSINLDTVRAQYTSPRIHNPPFFPPPGYYRGEREGGISLAKPLPILHCPWRSAILPFHLAHLIFFFFFLIQTYRGTRDLPETKR